MPHRKASHLDFISYWDSFYRQDHLQEPSDFAAFVHRVFLASGQSVLEIGCGNGRDAHFLSRAGMKVTGVDLSAEAIAQCREGNHRAEFIQGDFSELHLPERFHNIYSRFTLHSVDEAAERRTLAGVAEHLAPGGTFFIEVRTILDELCGQGERISEKEWIHQGHYRRFIIPENLLGRLRKAGFLPHYIHLARGLARWQSQDPIVLRVAVKLAA